MNELSDKDLREFEQDFELFVDMYIEKFMDIHIAKSTSINDEFTIEDWEEGMALIENSTKDKSK